MDRIKTNGIVSNRRRLLGHLYSNRRLSISMVLTTLTCLAFVALIWSLSTSIKIHTHTIGTFQSQHSPYHVNHPYGGRIKSLLVKEGSKVKKGDTLVFLTANAHFDKMKTLQLQLITELVKYEFVGKQDRKIRFFDLVSRSLRNDSLNKTQKYDLESLLRRPDIQEKIKSSVG